MFRAIRLLLAACIAWAALAQAAPAIAQTGAKARLAQVSSQAFPSLSLYVAVDDASGSRVEGLTPEQFQVIEDNQPRPARTVTQIQVPSRQVFVINTAPGLGVRDSRGRTRFDFVRQALLAWWADPEAGAYGDDDLSVLTGDGDLVRHSPASAQLASALDHLTPTFEPPKTGYNLLLDGLNLLTGPSAPPGTARIVIFFTSLPADSNEAARTDAISRAQQADIAIYPVLIDTPQALDTPQAAALGQVADQTGGQLIVFDPEQPLGGLGNRILQQRLQYRVDYTSQANISGAHEVRLQVSFGGQSLATNTQIYSVQLEPPQAAFIQPPSLITRASDDDRLPVEDLPPTHLPLQLLVTFPDGHPRPLTRSELIVDGQVVAQNTQPPFEAFDWDLTVFKQSGEHRLQAQITDSLGLQARSLEQAVTFQVTPPVSGLKAIGPALGSFLLVLLVLAAGIVAAFTLLRLGRRPARLGRGTLSARQASAGARRLQRASLQRVQPGGPPEAFLVPIGDHDQEAIPLVGADISLGRDPSLSAFPLDDPSVSSLHARLIRQAGGEYLLRDQGSVAGTWINYQQLTDNGQTLQHGDLVHIGRVAFRFQRSGEPVWPEIQVRPADDDRLEPVRKERET